MPGELDLPPGVAGCCRSRFGRGAGPPTVRRLSSRWRPRSTGSCSRTAALLHGRSSCSNTSPSPGDGPAQLVPEGGEILAGLWRYRTDGGSCGPDPVSAHCVAGGRDPDWRGGWSADADLPLRSSGRPFFQRDQIHLFGGFVHRGGQWRTAGYRPRRAFPQARTGAGVQRTEGTGRAADAGRLRKQRRRRHQVSSSGADPGARRDGRSATLGRGQEQVLRRGDTARGSFGWRRVPARDPGRPRESRGTGCGERRCARHVGGDLWVSRLPGADRTGPAEGHRGRSGRGEPLRLGVSATDHPSPCGCGFSGWSNCCTRASCWATAGCSS